MPFLDAGRERCGTGSAGRADAQSESSAKSVEPLGLVKFMFPNNYNIYFHDTLEQVFFSKSRRDFSHGCIRLETPADLAVWVLRNNPGWDMDHVRAESVWERMSS